MKKLAGTLFVYNGESQDYCYLESIISLMQFCDHVFVVDAGSTDTTLENLYNAFSKEDKVTIIMLDNSVWQSQHGKEKLNYFSNIAIEEAQKQEYEWQFNLQADEVVHEESYKYILQAIEENEEGFFCSRINLWKTPYHKLNVPQHRLPCSTEIIRLAKTSYRSTGDAESLAVDNPSPQYLDKINIWHYGFVRDKYIMRDKVIHIQEQVFGVDHDKKLDGINYFDPDRWFNPGTDLEIINSRHPEIMTEWIKERP